MADTPHQPTISVPVIDAVYSDAELNFIDESPPNLFPENQDSNWGYKRKIFCDVLQDAISQLDTAFNELFIGTSTDFIDEWEEEMGVPLSTASIGQRRSVVRARLKKGPFTRSKVRGVIEGSLPIALGSPILLVPAGVPLDPAGTPLYGESGLGTTLYRIYENPANFSYEVWIVNTTTPDIPSLTRELARITPAGITFTIDNTKSNILDYFRQVRTQAPNVYWTLDDASTPAVESLGTTGYNLASTGAVTFGNATVITSATSGSVFFSDASISYIRNASVGVLAAPDNMISVEAWIRPQTLPTAFNDKAILWKPNSTFLKLFNDNTKTVIQFDIYLNGAWVVVRSKSSITALGIYHVAATYDGVTLKLYVNGTLDTAVAAPGPLASVSASEIAIGGLNGGPAARGFNGAIDEVAIYGYPLSAAQVLTNYRTGKGLL